MDVYKKRGKYIYFIDIKNKRGKFTCEEFVDENDIITGQMVGIEPFGDVYLMKTQDRYHTHVVCIEVYEKLVNKGYDIEKYMKKYL